MKYKDQRTLFHISPTEAEATYTSRFNASSTVHIDFSIGGAPAFCTMDAELYHLLITAERLNTRICQLEHELPSRATAHYLLNCLIDEIVITNEIEGVNSSRREIGTVLEKLEHEDRQGRFHGIVEKYVMLQRGTEIPLLTCENIRALYDDLVLPEVVAQNKRNAPDGRLFRAHAVEVLDSMHRPIHHGLEPEEKIIKALESAFAMLEDNAIDPVVRMALFHFLFAYIHPFYDGNGRMNRFISSYLLTREFSPLVGLGLSFAVKERINAYYKAFAVCEHPLNRGDLTPFVIIFAEILIGAMERMRDSLEWRTKDLERFREIAETIPGFCEGKAAEVRDRRVLADELIQAALFAEHGCSARDLADMLGVSVPTAYSRLVFFEERGLLRKVREGKNVWYTMDLDVLAGMWDGAKTQN